MCVCVCMCVHACGRVHVDVCNVCVCRYVRTYVCMYACMYVYCMYVFIRKCLRQCVVLNMYLYVASRVHTSSSSCSLARMLEDQQLQASSLTRSELVGMESQLQEAAREKVCACTVCLYVCTYVGTVRVCLCVLTCVCMPLCVQYQSCILMRIH